MKIAAVSEYTVIIKLTCICEIFKSDFIAGKIGMSIEFPKVMKSGMEPIAMMTIFCFEDKLVHSLNDSITNENKRFEVIHMVQGIRLAKDSLKGL